MEIESSAILGLAGSDQFLCIFKGRAGAYGDRMWQVPGWILSEKGPTWTGDPTSMALS